ncbi:phosphoribosylglycinamide formyltransferase, formyltetrahydrofolate-dependent [Idiomarina sp. A28L]|uniref:phosphoribosylglycinamide formyltransferase n=1 Tax=Idiomarina sp. A28L TaxID=1036674 RepID=UPI0002138AE0|nr:phosphoribosylglycinamide formyltransferase [Idiomarina sp. A28L]EGN74292.1 phosphoribosylglycinamide formyltransferase, formyltetrahydrofolate-dependent [Idiomarina sp. A28L]
MPSAIENPIKKRIVVLISGTGSNMLNIAEHCQDNKINGDVVAVIANRADAAGLAKAAELGIATEFVPHTSFADREDYDQALVERVQSYQPDLIILAGFMRVLTPVFVSAFADRIMNIHPSLLPKYKGMHTHQRALDAGDEEHGVSVHFVTEELDGGPVILQSRVPIFPEDTAEDLQERVHEQEYRIYPLVIRWFCADRLKLTEEGAVLDGATLGEQGYAPE